MSNDQRRIMRRSITSARGCCDLWARSFTLFRRAPTAYRAMRARFDRVSRMEGCRAVMRVPVVPVPFTSSPDWPAHSGSCWLRWIDSQGFHAQIMRSRSPSANLDSSEPAQFPAEPDRVPSHYSVLVITAIDRDRGKPHSSAPPTPPDMRVRIRRFESVTSTVPRPMTEARAI